MKKAVLLILALALAVSFAGCSNKTDETTTVSTTRVSQTESTTKASGITEPLAEFEPFECTGEYYSFDRLGHPVSENGVEFFVSSEDSVDEYPNTYTILYKIGDKEKVLYKINHEIDIWGYVDNALYFSISDDYGYSGLYRIEIEYDETGDIADSKFSLVSNDYFVLVRPMKNSLIVSNNWSPSLADYALLDTLTGEITPTEYNFEADYSDYSNVAGINEEQALEIAKKTLENIDYWTNSWGVQDEEGIPPYSKVDSSKFMVKPYYVSSNDKMPIENFPDYAWYFALNYGVAFEAYISVNAVTGNICYIDIQLND